VSSRIALEIWRPPGSNDEPLSRDLEFEEPNGNLANLVIHFFNPDDPAEITVAGVSVAAYLIAGAVA